MDQIKRDLNVITDVALQINGLGFKIKQDGSVSDEKMNKLNALTDVIEKKAKDIYKTINSLKEHQASLKTHNENLKKGIAAQKRKTSEAQLLSDTYEDENKKTETGNNNP